MHNIELVSFLTDEIRTKWKKFVGNHKNANFFQSPVAFEFFYSVQNYEPLLITIEEQEEVKGILLVVLIKEPGIKSIFSKRCIAWGGPLCYTLKVAYELIGRFNEHAKTNSIFIEFRNLFDISNFNDVFLQKGYNFETRINYLVEIESVDTNKKRLNENRRRQINKSLKSGTKIIQPESTEQIKQFYNILKLLYLYKVKKPLPSFDFFEKFYENKAAGIYLLIEYNGKIIGGIMCPIYRDTIYEWYVCGLDSKYKAQSPSVLATWAPIEYAAINGLKYFDFMGAGRPENDYGVREFKSKFGGKLVSFGRYIKINKPFLFSFGKTALKIYKKIR